MATIRERKKADGSVSYQAQVRLKGFAPQNASFDRKTDAKRWIQATEAAIREGRHFKTTEAKNVELRISLRVKVPSAICSKLELQTCVLKSTEEISKVQILPAPGRFYRKTGIEA